MTWEQIVRSMRRLGAEPGNEVPGDFAARTMQSLHTDQDQPSSDTAPAVESAATGAAKPSIDDAGRADSPARAAPAV